jgi:hypothetical protein
MPEKDVYQMLLHYQDTNERLMFFTENLQEANERCKRIVEAESKKGRKVEGVVVLTKGVPASYIGKSFNVINV